MRTESSKYAWGRRGAHGMELLKGVWSCLRTHRLVRVRMDSSKYAWNAHGVLKIRMGSLRCAWSLQLT